MSGEQIVNRIFEAVIFDVDQTLVDSAKALAKAWGTWLAEVGVAPDPSRSFHGWTSEDIVRLCVPEERVAEGLKRIEELETSITDTVTALPGAARALADLPASRVAVGTSGSRAVAWARLTAAGLSVPDVMVSATDVERGKPAPDIFLAAAERLGVDPADCLVVEDSPAGVQAARAAGMTVVALLTSTPRADLDADLVIGTLDDVNWRVDDAGVHLDVAPAAQVE